jgi:hypothetical protein
LIFRIHCGLSFGSLLSEIFAAPAHANTQRVYHSVGEESFVEISKLLDIANAPIERIYAGEEPWYAVEEKCVYC